MGYLKTQKISQDAFTKFTGKDEVVPVPIAHGEGDFTQRQGFMKELVKNKQTIFKYSLKI